MVDAALANRWTTAMKLYHNKKLNNIVASVRNIQRMLDEVVLGAYRPAKVPFISEDNKIEFCQKIGKKLSLQMKTGFVQKLFI